MISFCCFRFDCDDVSSYSVFKVVADGIFGSEIDGDKLTEEVDNSGEKVFEDEVDKDGEESVLLFKNPNKKDRFDASVFGLLLSVVSFLLLTDSIFCVVVDGIVSTFN